MTPNLSVDEAMFCCHYDRINQPLGRLLSALYLGAQGSLISGGLPAAPTSTPVTEFCSRRRAPALSFDGASRGGEP